MILSVPNNKCVTPIHTCKPWHAGEINEKVQLSDLKAQGESSKTITINNDFIYPIGAQIIFSGHILCYMT